MPDAEKLTPADPADLADAIAFALRFNRRKRFHQGDEFMARITAEHITRYLENAGYVVMKKPPSAGGGGSPGARTSGY